MYTAPAAPSSSSPRTCVALHHTHWLKIYRFRNLNERYRNRHWAGRDRLGTGHNQVIIILAMMKLICILCVLVSGAFGLNNGLGLKPQMGWNSWNHFACNISDRLVRQTVDVIVSNGLDKWYKYVNIDDCWASFKRDANGIIIPDDDFPNMTALAEYIHSKGLLFGLYTSVGPKTCMGRAGSFGYETQDASTYAKWGVDYLKYDFCYSRKLDPTKRYPLMRDALNKTGRPIFLSMSEGGRNDPAMWARPMSNSWRTTKDIKDYWERYEQ